MRLLRHLKYFIACTLLCAGFCSCVKDPPEDIPEEEPIEEPVEEPVDVIDYMAINFFASNCIYLYYLWTEEIMAQIDFWQLFDVNAEPKAKVKEIRYKENGVEVDKWTMMTSDFESLTNSLAGVSTTYGCDIVLYWFDEAHTSICAVVTVVYAGSPAERAGLKRGDVIYRINGKSIPAETYSDVITNDFLYSPSCTLGILDRSGETSGRSVTMTAATMYEDPIIFSKVFGIGDKKVGYLVYTNFTLRSILDLANVTASFKEQGVSELILDLRYNGGGYVTTENALGCLLAPLKNVTAGDVYSQDVYNKTLNEFYWNKYGDDALNTHFSTPFTYEDEKGQKQSIDITASNPDLKKIYAIVSSGTASASESLLACLMPYMDVTVIGEKTYGKFCSGITYGAKEWYDDYADYLNEKQLALKDYTGDWGIYVMVGTYADCNGKNPCKPDGLKPSVSVTDSPDKGYDWGDERDPMLRAALKAAGMDLADEPVTKASALTMDRSEKQIVKESFGMRVNNMRK